MKEEIKEAVTEVVDVRFLSIEKKFEVIERTFDALRNQQEKEMYSWRALSVFVLILLIAITSVGMYFSSIQRGWDNKERARNWTLIQTAIETNKHALRDNKSAIDKVDEHLRQCSGCHSHDEAIKRLNGKLK